MLGVLGKAQGFPSFPLRPKTLRHTSDKRKGFIEVKFSVAPGRSSIPQGIHQLVLIFCAHLKGLYLMMNLMDIPNPNTMLHQ